MCCCYNKRTAKVHGGSLSGVLRRHFEVAAVFDVVGAKVLRLPVSIYFYRRDVEDKITKNIPAE